MTFDYDQMDSEERPFAARLAEWWVWHLGPEPVLDVGAGSGVYVEELRRQGVAAQGIDIADPQPRPDLVSQHSLFDRWPLTYSRMICLEVFEHLEPDRTQEAFAALWNLAQPGAWIVFSAAIPGQGGSGHINCRPRSEWQSLAQAQGFRVNTAAESDIRQFIQQGYHMGWFVQNAQIWQRPIEL